MRSATTAFIGKLTGYTGSLLNPWIKKKIRLTGTAIPAIYRVPVLPQIFQAFNLLSGYRASDAILKRERISAHMNYYMSIRISFQCLVFRLWKEIQKSAFAIHIPSSFQKMKRSGNLERDRRWVKQ